MQISICNQVVPLVEKMVTVYYTTVVSPLVPFFKVMSVNECSRVIVFRTTLTSRMSGNRGWRGLVVAVCVLIMVALMSVLQPVEQHANDDGSLSRPPVWTLCCRALHLGLALSPLLLTGPAAMLIPPLAPMHHQVLLGALEGSGAAFIKWGQWASTRPDLLPPGLCDALSKLHR